MFTYILSKREGKKSSLLEEIKNSLQSKADSILIITNKDVYNRTLGGEYWWGANGAVTRQAILLQIANMISPNQDYIQTIQDVIAYLFGRY